MSINGSPYCEGLKAATENEQARLRELGFTSGGDYLCEDPPKLAPVLENVCERKDLIQIIGKSKTKKTFLALQLAICLASGRKFLKKFPVPQPFKVVYLNYEIPGHWLHRRVKDICSGLNVTPTQLEDRLLFLNFREMKGRISSEETVTRVSQTRADILLIDPLYQFHPQNEVEQQGWIELFGKLRRLRDELDLTIFYVHHDTKGSVEKKDPQDRGSGSNLQSREYDAAFLLSPHQKPGATLLEIETRNYASHDSITLSFENGLHYWDQETPAAKRSGSSSNRQSLESYIPNMRRIIEKQIAARGEVTTRQAKEALEKSTGLGKNRRDDLINLMRDNGEITISGRHKFIFPLWNVTAKEEGPLL